MTIVCVKNKTSMVLIWSFDGEDAQLIRVSISRETKVFVKRVDESGKRKSKLVKRERSLIASNCYKISNGGATKFTLNECCAKNAWLLKTIADQLIEKQQLRLNKNKKSRLLKYQSADGHRYVRTSLTKAIES